MKKIIIPSLVLISLFTSCSSATNAIFGKKTPIEKYEEKIEDNGLEKTAEGRQWKVASEMALQHPVNISLPYSQAGNFSMVRPQALGLKFMAKHGERLHFRIDKKDSTSFVLYAELYKQQANGERKLLLSPDTNMAEFNFDIDETATYVLKIQPQLFRTGNYSLSIGTGPSLSFPVAHSKAYIGSVWGDSRDGGKRSHEGIDIFAAKRTPAIAATDGYITGVREGGIGGKTVWMRPDDGNVHLYYAHLDEQLVNEGQLVKKGDTIGLVGNTGNAKYTPSHLHFGVYTSQGPVDPSPFVSRVVKPSPSIPQKKLPDYLRLTKDIIASAIPVKKNTLLMPLAVTDKGYIAELPNGRLIETSFASVQSANQPLKKTKTVLAASLYKMPGSDNANTGILSAGSAVSVLGYYNEFVFVESGQVRGWVLETSLKG